jgi:hypothetical protein
VSVEAQDFGLAWGMSCGARRDQDCAGDFVVGTYHEFGRHDESGVAEPLGDLAGGRRWLSTSIGRPE